MLTLGGVLQRPMGSLGGRQAHMDCMQAIETLTGPPLSDDESAAATERTLAEVTLRSLFAAGGVPIIVQVAGSKVPPVSAGAAAATLLRMFCVVGAPLRAPFLQHGGLAAMVRIVRNPFVSLLHRACAAGCLWNYLIPDEVNVPREEAVDATLRRTNERISAKEKAGKSTATAGAAPAETATIMGYAGVRSLLPAFWQLVAYNLYPTSCQNNVALC